MASSEAELKDKTLKNETVWDGQSETSQSPRRWANVVQADSELSFPEAGYMSQASSVMEMDTTKPHSLYGQQWEWVDHFEDGMVFVCTTGTFEESMKRMLLGLPKQYMINLKKLNERSHIFLFNKTTKLMHAGFHPCGEADWNICPQAFTPIRRDANGNEKRQPPGSKYPAQMPIKVFRHLEPLPEIAFKGVLKDPRKPKRLKRAHVRQLLRIFQKAVAPAGCSPPAPLPAPAFIRLTTPTGSESEPGVVSPYLATPGPAINTHFLTPPITVRFNSVGASHVSPSHSRSGSNGSQPASASSFNSPTPSVAFSGSYPPSNKSWSPQPCPGITTFPIQLRTPPRIRTKANKPPLAPPTHVPVDFKAAPPMTAQHVHLGPIPMPLTENKFDASQKFKMRSTDALKRFQAGNIRPVNHLFNSLYDQITTLQVQLQQQQLIINNLSFQVTQRNLMSMQPIYPAQPQNGNSPQQAMSPMQGNYSPPNQPKVIPLNIHMAPLAPSMRSPSHFSKDHMMHHNGFYAPHQVHHVPTHG